MDTAHSNSTNLQPAEGWLDGISGDRVVGWAWHPNQPELEAQVQLMAGEHVVAATRASLSRADLEAAHKRNGVCAFEFPIDHRLPVGASLTARIVLGDQAFALPGGPIVLQGATTSALPASHTRASSPNLAPEQLSVPLSHLSQIVGHVDSFGPDTLRGWVWHNDLSKGPVSIALYDGATPILSFVAKSWRSDLADLRQGDGRCGFSVTVPKVLRDGELHTIDLRLPDTTYSLLAEPLQMRWTAASADTAQPAPTVNMRRGRLHSTTVQFSFIINFYDMRREAERTLTSLSRSYQRGIEDISYEVICIDNGSNPPLERAWIESFGPEFSLVRPEHPLGSPCHAINQAARQAKGRFLAIMIDGAHLLTPGILREAMDAFESDPDAVIALRRWFIGGDQRWLSSVGYRREMEDILFSRIDWPNDGYQLFRIGMPIGESPNDWFDGLIESNCLFLPATLYQKLGGMDEAFNEAGGGFSNLDLFRRAALAIKRPVMSFVGEATFHPFHGGTTSNVTDEEKEKRVRAYAAHYRALRGEEFLSIPADSIRYRGSLRYPNAMTTSRQRPLYATQLGITDQIRPGFLPQHFDHGARLNVQSAFVESGLYKGTQWAGIPVQLAPADLINIQMILHKVRPACIVTTSRDDGLIACLDSITQPLALEALRIIRVLPTASSQPSPPRVHTIIGHPYHPGTLGQVQRQIGTAEDMLVLFAPQDNDYLPIDSIRSYAQFVSYGSYFIFLGTVFGQPWLAYSKNWYLTAIRKFIEYGAPFKIDSTRDRGILSLCVSGYLQRACDFTTVWRYDPDLDHLNVQESANESVLEALHQARH